MIRTFLFPALAALSFQSACTGTSPIGQDTDSHPGSPDGETYVEAILDADGAISVTASGEGMPDQPYQIGSISKYVCTLAALDLAEDSLISLDAPVSTLLPGYSGPGGDEVTLAHLLQHRAGLPDGLVAAFGEDPDVLTRDMDSLTATNRYAAGALNATPGSRYDYVISNWLIVQAILEHAAGMPLATLVEQRVFTPAGMEDSLIFSGALPDPDAPQTDEPLPPIPAWAGCAGGAAATADDLIRLMRFAYHGAGYSEDTLSRLTTITSPESDYALGGRIRTVDRDGEMGPITWLSGSNGDFESFGAYDPATDTGMAVVSQAGNREAVSARRDAWLDDLADGQ